MQKGFLYIFFSHTDFFPTIQIFLVIYTDFVLDQSGMSGFSNADAETDAKWVLRNRFRPVIITGSW